MSKEPDSRNGIGAEMSATTSSAPPPVNTSSSVAPSDVPEPAVVSRQSTVEPGVAASASLLVEEYVPGVEVAVARVAVAVLVVVVVVIEPVQRRPIVALPPVQYHRDHDRGHHQHDRDGDDAGPQAGVVL